VIAYLSDVQVVRGEKYTTTPKRGGN